jgi:hypothetical protein
MESIGQQLAHLPDSKRVPSKKHQYEFKNIVLKRDFSAFNSPSKKSDVMNIVLGIF